MVRESKNKRGMIAGQVFAFALLLGFTFYNPMPAKAQQSVTLSLPLNSNLNSQFGMRTHPRTGVYRRHTGVDLRARTPTPIPQRSGSLQCYPNRSGYGNQGRVSYACGVVEAFSHLSVCDGSRMITGESGAPGSPHLHYEVIIDGTFVDPILATAAGTNLCDAATRQRLIADAQQKLQNNAGDGFGGGGGGSTSSSGSSGTSTGTNTTPAPPQQPTVSVIYVPSGGSNPVTGVINTGPAYNYVVNPDGRVDIQVEITDMPNTFPVLPPSTENFVISTNSTTNPVTGCATDTWTAMVNQAVLQTRREMLMNERFVTKPDSVMAYSCLTQQMPMVGRLLGPIFSESQRWANAQIDILNGQTATVTVDMGRNSLDGAVINVAYEPQEAWLRMMFNHDFLGGYGSSTAPPSGGGGETDADAGGQQEMAPCGTMARVWQLAKCLNVDPEPTFYRFEDLITLDPRQYPPNYACNNSGITQNMIDIARGRDARRDAVNTYLPMLTGTSCNPPIATGITVERQSGEGQITSTIRYADGLCLTAGCSYQNTGGSGTGRCEIRQP